MLVNFDPLKLLDEPIRSHPWSKTEYDERPGQYCNFITNPELISTMLEDFNPHDDKQAVQTFYSFLRWINGSDSYLETNDCALREGIIDNPDALFKYRHKIDGRVEILFRQHNVNCQAELVTWLFRMLSLYLQIERPDFLSALIDIKSAPTDYILLPGNQNAGYRIRITFNAYGNGEDEVWACLNTVFQSIWNAAKRLNSAISEGDNISFP